MKKISLFSFFLIIFLSTCEYEPYSQGQVLYKVHCSNCHGENGEGLKLLIPPLANVDFLEERQKDLACIIKNGIKGPISINGNIYNTEMVGIKTLNDIQINNIINYINNAWGNDYGDSNVVEVKNALENCTPVK